MVSRDANAQARGGAAVIDGTVSDTNLVSLSDATASILGSSVHVTTGANGRFRINGLHAGEYILVVHRLGFKPVSASVQIAGADTLRMAFPLQPIATALDTVSIIGERMTARLSDFDQRKKEGFGHFITAAEIELRGSVFMADVFRTQLSVEIADDGHGRQRLMNTRGMTGLLGTGVCPFQVFVDGVLQPPAPDINILVKPSEVAGVEIYSGGATIPLQYKTTAGSFCGVILIWTKTG